jgi:hypothetical protein
VDPFEEIFKLIYAKLYDEWHAAQGGIARAQRLTATRRKEIAHLGWKAFVNKYFPGNEAGAKLYASRLFAWGSDKPYWDTQQQKWFRPALPPPATISDEED